MPNSRATALGTGRFAATAILAAVSFASAAIHGSSRLSLGTSPGPMATLYAGSSATYRPVRVPMQALHAQARQALVPTSTISVTYHGFAGQAQAKAAFQAAVDIWQSIVVSSRGHSRQRLLEQPRFDERHPGSGTRNQRTERRRWLLVPSFARGSALLVREERHSDGDLRPVQQGIPRAGTRALTATCR